MPSATLRRFARIPGIELMGWHLFVSPSIAKRGSILAALVVTIGLSGASTRAQAPATSWPQFRGSAPLTGLSSASLPPSLKVQWTYEAGEAIESSAAIADGAVYVTVASGELVALSLDKGQVRWKYTVALGFGESSPAVAGGTVFVGDLGGILHAVNAADGKAAWTYKTKSEIKSSPVVVGDVVMIGSYDGTLYGIGMGDGKPRWEVKTENYVHGTPAVIDGIAYFAGCDEIFRAVRASDGKIVFEAPIGAYTGASVALSGGAAYFGTFDNEVLALDLKTHKFRWRYKHPEREFPFYSSAAVASGKVVVGGRDKMIHGIDAASGKGLWTYMTRARVESSPAIAGNRVYVGSGDGRFYVLELATGAKVWEYDMAGPLSASPAIAGGRIVIGSQDGRLVCFG
jgi:eukaryotic-like serine/threonine-protein kinase